MECGGDIIIFKANFIGRGREIKQFMLCNKGGWASPTTKFGGGMLTWSVEVI
jgi:hypothetical protein